MLTPILALALLAAPAASDPIPSTRVAHGDLDLTTQPGRDRLDRRLDGAVTRVCPDADKARELWRKRAARRCLRETGALTAQQRDRAVARARLSQLTASRR